MAIGIVDETGAFKDPDLAPVIIPPADPDAPVVDPVAVDPAVPLTLISLKVYFNNLDGTAPDPKGVLAVDVDASVIDHDDVGRFHYDVGPALTAQKGTLTAEWDYTVDGVEFTFVDNMVILDQMPVYDAMAEEAKLIVERASWFFADLFDSTAGGPWLAENFQTHYNYERVSQLMAHAVVKMNTIGFPVTAYGITPDENMIPDNFTGLAIWGTKLEIIRHLIRSYTEQPNFPNMQTTYTDRRDYTQRWLAVLEEEKPEYERAVKMTKRGLLSLGSGSLLVAGGIYGGTAGRSFFVAGMYSAQVRAFRFYPASPSSMWSAQAFGR
jgi:hypothetical protein